MRNMNAGGNVRQDQSGQSKTDEKIHQMKDTEIERLERITSREEPAGRETPKTLQFPKSLIPCQFACPQKVNVPEMLQAAASADWAAAWQVFAAGAPLPFSTAYLCRGECRHACHLHETDSPVDVCLIERTAAESALNAELPDSEDTFDRTLRGHEWTGRSRLKEGLRLSEPDFARQNARFGLEPEARECACAMMDEPTRRVAVVGAVPAALSAAWHLARAGCEVTVFSSERATGGWLKTAVATLRLPLKALQKDIAGLRAAGVLFEDVAGITDPRALREQGYNVVLVAPETASAERRSALVRNCFRGLVDADAFVHAAGRQEVQLPQRITVIGTGFDAAHTARTASMHGCAEVRLMIHGSEHECSLNAAECRMLGEDGIRVMSCDLFRAAIRRTEKGFEISHPDAEEVVCAEMILLDRSVMPHTADGGETIMIGPAVPPTLALDVQGMLTDTPGVFAIDPERLSDNSIAEESALGARAAEIAREFLEGEKPGSSLISVWSCPGHKPQGASSPIQRGARSMRTTVNAPRSAAQEAARCRQCNTTAVIDHAKCTGCLACIEACPSGALYATDESGRPLAHPWRRKPVIHVDRHLCDTCGTCVKKCAAGAASLRKVVMRHAADTAENKEIDTPSPRMPSWMADTAEE